jgi:hypothetical protein
MIGLLRDSRLATLSRQLILSSQAVMPCPSCRSHRENRLVLKCGLPSGPRHTSFMEDPAGFETGAGHTTG